MSIAGRLPRLSVQTKVLLPVLAFLVLLPAITLWIVYDHISQQVHTESRQTLATAETVFLKSLEIRAGDLLSRYRNEVTDSRFWIVAQRLALRASFARRGRYACRNEWTLL